MTLKKLLAVALVACCTMPLFAQASAKKSVAVAKVSLLSSLATSKKNMDELSQARTLAQSIDGHMITAIVDSKKFKILERSADLATLKEENELGAFADGEMGADPFSGFKKADYLIIVRIENFNHAIEPGVFNGITLIRQTVSVAAQMKVVDPKTSEIIEASTIQKKKIFNSQAVTGADASMYLHNELPKMAKEIAQESVARLTSIAYPAKIIDVEDSFITINRGEGTFAEGDMVLVHGATKTIVDPDTQERIVIKGHPIGKARIVLVERNYAQAEMLDKKTARLGGQVSLIKE